MTRADARPVTRAVLLAWIVVAAILCLVSALSIADFRFPDPDDALRLVEARDLLAGQSWWDVSQHRLASGAMHWSRLIDLPLVAVMAMAKPFVGAAMAERVAMVVVPLLTLLVVLALVYRITLRLLGSEHARTALLVAPLSVPLLDQLRPMRIDHHGWQVAFALAALLPLLGLRRDAREGALAGAALATLLTISLEGLPVAATLMAVVGVRWLLDPAEAPRFLGLVWTAALGAAVLHLATRGPAVFAPACDAVSPMWLAALFVAASGATLGQALGRGLLSRGVAGVLTAGACAATLLLLDPRCTAGPFEMLDPLVTNLWFKRINEGLPVWAQAPDWALMCIGLPLVGLVGSALALRAAPAERRSDWWVMLGTLAGAALVAVLVSRAAATANALAVPGAAFVLVTLLRRARRVASLPKRVAATAGALLVAAPGPAAAIVFALPGTAPAPVAPPPRPVCIRFDEVRGLDRLPPSRLFTMLDEAPPVLARTPHTAVASGHHRNAAAMRDVLVAFASPPAQARAIVARYRADYIVGCPGLGEPMLYDRVAPGGLWARLERGERIDWLDPVPMPGTPLLVWRVKAL